MLQSKIKLVIVIEATSGGVGKHVADLVTGLDKNVYEIYLIYSLTRSDQKFVSFLKKISGEVKLIEISIARNFSPITDLKTLFNALGIEIVGSQQFESQSLV